MTLIRIAAAPHGTPVSFLFDGKSVTGFSGESVAAACAAAGIVTLRRSAGDGGPRGAFCYMGTCQECVVLDAGVRSEACRLLVRDGLTLERA